MAEQMEEEQEDWNRNQQLLPLFQTEAYREYPGTQVRRLTAAEIEEYMAEQE